jgi:hypothetical protein
METYLQAGMDAPGDCKHVLRELMDGPDAWERTLREYAAAVKAEVRA